ncbi:hypothetical protein BD779DRAFT_1671900 [Infundibulicybe gibba]|nr:hypothetical protein BD779DRAFT_1671900 [Infundibulicybe gibba]
MSAIRRKDRRAALRSHASPYARAQPKQSYLSYLNPLRSRSTSEDITEQDSSPDSPPESSDEEPDISAWQFFQNTSINGKPAAPIVSSNRTPPHTGAFFPPVTPVRSQLPYPLQESSSPAKNLETVSTFLSERAGKSISNIEVEGLISLIQKSTPEDKPEPFRFSSSTPSTPGRGNSPFLPKTDNINFSFTTPGPSKQGPTPRKTLTKNPNGVYRWEGGGSAKPARSRNRYSSPAFGASRGGSDRVVLKDNGREAPKTDTKRRRVGDDLNSSSATPSGVSQSNIESPAPAPRSAAPEPSSNISRFPFPVSTPQTPQTPGSAPALTNTKTNSTPARLRIPGPTAKPTAPAIPSPLRQAWSGGSPASQSDSSDSQPPQKQTKAANFMAELIKEVTPPRKPDGSKRSRPPAHLEPPSPVSPSEETEPPSPRRSPRSRETVLPGQKPAEISSKRDNNGPTDEQRVSKKSKPSLSGLGAPSQRKSPAPVPSIVVEEVADFEMISPEKPIIETPDDEVKQNPPAIVAHDNTTTAIVLPMNGTQPAQTAMKEFISCRAPSPPLPSKQDKMDVENEPTVKIETKPLDPKAVASTMLASSLPTFVFTISHTFKYPNGPEYVKARELAKSMPKSSLATFDFAAPVEATKPVSAAVEKKGYSAAVMPSRAPYVPPAVKPFDWAAAGMKPPPAASGSTWSCKSCMLSNPADAVDKCTICGEPRADVMKEFSATIEKKEPPAAAIPSPAIRPITPPPYVPPVTQSFNWAAAGMKPPPAASGGTWSCKSCMLSNPADVVDKCTICGEPR